MSQSEEGRHLRREVGLFGAFSVGYADVGADLYITLGLVALYAMGAAPLALATAAIAYVLTGVTYAQLSKRYPVAGGSQHYAYVRFGPLHGFFAGWGLLLDYIIDIALLALASVGYLGFLIKRATGSGALLVNPVYAAASSALIAFLVVLNIIGIKASSRFNEIFVAIDLATLSVVLGVGGLLLALGGALEPRIPSIGGELPLDRFLYAVTISMASYIGVEASSQVAEEVKDAERVVPKAILLAVLATVAVALPASAFYSSLRGLGEEDAQHPFSSLASRVPLLGPYLGFWTSIVGTLITAASANAGVIGASRVAFSMGRDGLLPRAFCRLNSRGVPDVAIIASGAVAAGLLLVNAMLPGVALLDLVASLFNFGALLAYMYAHATLLSVYIEEGRGPLEKAQPILGFASCAALWALLFILHETGRWMALAWLAMGALLYLAGPRHRPATHARPRGADGGPPLRRLSRLRSPAPRSRGRRGSRRPSASSRV